MPKGWKMRLDGSKRSIMAPNGTLFKSRRSAYETMIQERYPNQEIEAMRGMLRHEDWVDNPELPEGWKVKPTEHNTFYMDRGGQLFKSSVQAAKFVETYAEHFSPEDVEKINKIARRNQPPREKSQVEWDSSDPSVPPGWVSRLVKKRRILKAADGSVYKTARLALEQMVKANKATEAGIIRDLMVTEVNPHGLFYEKSFNLNV